MGNGMELRCAVALLDQVMRQPLDHVVVLGMHHDQRAVPAGQRQDVQDLIVADLHGIVGHVDLERGVAVPDQRRQLLPQHLLRGVGDDQMEGIVDHRFGRRRLVILLHHLAQRHAAMLRRKRNHGRGAAEGSGDRAAVEIVGTHDAEARFLLDVAMAVDATRQHELAAGIDLPGPLALDIGSDLDDLAVSDRNVALGLAFGSDDTGIADDQIEVGHVPTLHPYSAAFASRPASASRRSRRAISVSSSALSVAVSDEPGARCLGLLIAPRRNSTSLRSARPIAGCTS